MPAVRLRELLAAPAELFSGGSVFGTTGLRGSKEKTIVLKPGLGVRNPVQAVALGETAIIRCRRVPDTEAKPARSNCFQRTADSRLQGGVTS